MKETFVVNDTSWVRTLLFSANRFHHKVKIESLDDFDTEREGWLKEAYLLSG